MPPAGFLIAIDGIDGAGKTTLANRLRDLLSENAEAVVSKEPTAGQYGAQLRASALTGRLPVAEEVRLLELDRAEHVAEVIAPALARDAFVILDRYYFSTVAYQGAAGGDAAAILDGSESIAPRPHVTLILDLDVAQALGRVASRGDVANHFEKASTLEACRRIFLDTAARTPGAVVIDASQPADAVLDACLRAVVKAHANLAAQRHGLTPAGAEAVMRLGTLAGAVP